MNDDEIYTASRSIMLQLRKLGLTNNESIESIKQYTRAEQFLILRIALTTRNRISEDWIDALIDGFKHVTVNNKPVDFGAHANRFVGCAKYYLDGIRG